MKAKKRKMFNTRFWGVRGSIPCPFKNYLKYGGNTSCVSVNCDDQLIIFDSGTGIRSLGNQIIKNKQKKINLMMSHTHWDHINGFPFFQPAYSKDFFLDIYCGNLKKYGNSIYNVLSSQMKHPTFPVSIDIFEAKIKYIDFFAGDSFFLTDEIFIETALLNHPKGATGYRVNFKNNSICYITDTEHKTGTADKNILNLIKNSDLVIYDCTYTDEEFPKHIGWGHSTWQEGIRLCNKAGAKNLAIFHHDPSHDDCFMDQVSNNAKLIWNKAFVASEGTQVNIIDNKLNFSSFDDSP